MEPIVLHQWEISPFCGKVRKVLKLKGRDFRVINYNGLLARKAAKLSPVGKLPVLDHGPDRIQDSSRIASYLDQRYPDPPLYPEGSRDRGHAHFWEDWADESLYWFEIYFRFNYLEALNRSVALLCEGRPRYERLLFKWLGVSSVRKSLKGQGLGRMEHADVEAEFVKHLEALEQILVTRSWLVGETQSIADLAVSAQLDEMVRTSHMKDLIFAYPALRAWLEKNETIA